MLSDLGLGIQTAVAFSIWWQTNPLQGDTTSYKSGQTHPGGVTTLSDSPVDDLTDYNHIRKT